ncbi:MAG: hypothetical protein HY816_20705 [Candidatus Wallbacteria bacterium]|nr:hypothetical protein [Candidatus Wallbacteria bacterium]
MAPRTTPGNRGGFGILWVLLFIAGVELGAAAVGQTWSAVRATEREEELRFRMLAYHRALAAYRQTYRRPPRALGELLENPRRIKFLQRLYLDPVAGAGEDATFATVSAPGGGISGVRSRSRGLARNGSQYSAWRVDARGDLREGSLPENGNPPGGRDR